MQFKTLLVHYLRINMGQSIWKSQEVLVRGGKLWEPLCSRLDEILLVETSLQCYSFYNSSEQCCYHAFLYFLCAPPLGIKQQSTSCQAKGHEMFLRTIVCRASVACHGILLTSAWFDMLVSKMGPWKPDPGWTWFHCYWKLECYS